MKKLYIIILLILTFTISKSQVNNIDFGASNSLFICDPPVYTTTNQLQCISINPVFTPSGISIMYYTTATGSVGTDCRNWLRLSNPGFSFIGSGSELQLRNAGNGSTILNPARFLVKDFVPGTRFGISFDVALSGYGGAFYFRCGNGQAYGDTVYMISRDSSSFMVMRIDGTNPAITQPSLKYSSSTSNTMWPNVPMYNFVPGINSAFSVYQKHTVAIFCNNGSVPVSYNYIGLKTVNPQSFDVYLDSVLDIDNMYDDFYGLNRNINSFMLAGSDAMCANSGPYLGDTLIVDNIRWTSDFIVSPLPVHLSDFDAHLNFGNEVLLSWQDQTPSNQNHYEVQMSNDGVYFSSIGMVIGNDYLNIYSFNYKANKCGQYFFRLRFDGNKYSEILPISIDCPGPKITAGKQVLNVTTNTPGTLMLISTFGQTLSKTVLSRGYQQVRVAVPAGIYIARFVDSGGNTNTQKVFVQ